MLEFGTSMLLTLTQKSIQRGVVPPNLTAVGAVTQLHDNDNENDNLLWTGETVFCQCGHHIEFHKTKTPMYTLWNTIYINTPRFSR